MSGLNSNKTCLQAPHGNVGLLPEDAIAILLIFLCSSETVLNNSIIFAHILKPYKEFSTLQPEKILPVYDWTAAPTLNLE